MKKAHSILEKMRNLLLSEEFKKNHRAKEEHFTRSSLITFPTLVTLILNQMRKSLQVELNIFTKWCKCKYISKQVFSAARKKMLPSAFTALNDELIKEFYLDNDFQTFLGFRLLVVDGSTIQLPEGEMLKEKYGTCTNQNENATMNMAKISYVYDPLNELTLHAIIGPYGSCERTMAFEHISNVSHDGVYDLYLYDRGYPSILLVFGHIVNKRHFLIRSSKEWLSVVRKVLTSNSHDEIVEIHPKMLPSKKRKEFKKLFPKLSLDHKIKIRVLVIDLCTGEKEILITSLLDKNEYKYEIFKDLYGVRWCGEENYKFHKERIEVENFSGKSPCAVEQDFHATILAANVRALIAEEVHNEQKDVLENKYKFKQKINKNVSAGALKDTLINALLDPAVNLMEFCEDLKKTIKKSKIYIKPNRAFARTKKTRRKFPMNARRAL
jgi:hypothetical protein